MKPACIRRRTACTTISPLLLLSSVQLITDMLRFGRPALHRPYTLSTSNNRITRTLPPSVLGFVKAASGGPSEMDSKKQSEPESKTVDSMSSLGEGYATRSDEEGFGGIYGGNQSVSKYGEEKDVREDAQEFDHDQGSGVKEKEKARNQHKVGS